MSSEEEGVENIGDLTVPVFRVKLCVWRNPVLVDYFKYIDKESQSLSIRGKQGSKLQPRIHTDKSGDTDPPAGLPRSLYDSGWLAQQVDSRGEEWVVHELTVSQDVFEMLEFAATV